MQQQSSWWPVSLTCRAWGSPTAKDGPILPAISRPAVIFNTLLVAHLSRERRIFHGPTATLSIGDGLNHHVENCPGVKFERISYL